MGRSDGAPEQSEFTGRSEDDLVASVASKLGKGIELANRIDVVPEELNADRPRGGGRPDVDDATAQREGSLLGDLGLGFVTLVFEPFDEVQGIRVAGEVQSAKSGPKVVRGEGPLDEGGHRGDDERRGVVGSGIGEADQRGQTFRDDIDMRELGFVRQDFPIGERENVREAGAITHPGLEILKCGFLGLEAIEDQDHRVGRVAVVQDGGEQRVRGIGHA